MVFLSHVYDTDPGIRKQVRRVRFAWPAILLTIGAMLSMAMDMWYPSAILWIGAVVMWFIFPRSYRRQWLKQVRKQTVTTGAKTMFGERTVEFDDEKLTIDMSDIVHETLRWDVFSKFEITDNYFFLYLASSQGHIIPKRAMTAAEIDYFLADDIFNRGGSYIQMSRFKPTDDNFRNDFNLELFTENNIKLLVTIGGDDTASTANRIAHFLEEKRYPISNIHVPKTIDNDLPLPGHTPTFGYESALDKGATIARTVYMDARTSGTWFVLAAMGRSAGHLAFGIGTACHYPMIIIPEMFNNTPITCDKIVRLLISSIVKRKLMNMDYGAAIISEGVFHSLSDEEIAKSGVCFSYDDHGHPELGKVSKAHIFNTMLEDALCELKIRVKSRPVEIGYEVRCQTPVAYDLVYCSSLGMGVYKLFSRGISGCMVFVDEAGDISPIYLKDLQDPFTRKIPPRMVAHRLISEGSTVNSGHLNNFSAF